jgi:hypothetical protein
MARSGTHAGATSQRLEVTCVSTPGIARRKTRVNALMTRQSIYFAKLLRRMMDHPNSGLPEFVSFSATIEITKVFHLNLLPNLVFELPPPAKACQKMTLSDVKRRHL